MPIRLCLLLFCCGILANCTSIPEPGGSRFDTIHYQVSTDTFDTLFAEKAASLSEFFHEALTGYFGGAPEEPLPIVIYRDRQKFDATLPKDYPVKPDGIYFHSTYTKIYWRNDTQGMVRLAHELVHHFIHYFMSDVPHWKDEGIAYALAYDIQPIQRFYGWNTRNPHIRLGLVYQRPFHCPVQETTRLSNGEIHSHFIELPDITNKVDNYARKVRTAAAMIRFGMETQHWSFIQEAKDWEPEMPAFLEWLRNPLSHQKYKQFPPLVELPLPSFKKGFFPPPLVHSESLLETETPLKNSDPLFLPERK